MCTKQIASILSLLYAMVKESVSAVMQPPLVKKKRRVITVKICGREKSYGKFLYVHIPKSAETELSWSPGDIAQITICKEDDSLVLKRIFKAEG